MGISRESSQKTELSNFNDIEILDYIDTKDNKVKDKEDTIEEVSTEMKIAPKIPEKLNQIAENSIVDLAEEEKSVEEKADPEALIEAAWNGDAERVKKQLSLGADIDAEGGAHSGTALNCAARNGHEDVLRILLSHSPNVNALNKWGHSSLHQAALYNRFECIQLLLEAGADATLRVPENGWQAGSLPRDFVGLSAGFPLAKAADILFK